MNFFSEIEIDSLIQYFDRLMIHEDKFHNKLVDKTEAYRYPQEFKFITSDYIKILKKRLSDLDAVVDTHLEQVLANRPEVLREKLYLDTELKLDYLAEIVLKVQNPLKLRMNSIT